MRQKNWRAESVRRGSSSRWRPARPRALRQKILKRKRNIDFSTGKKKRKKKPNKWRLNRPHGQERSLVKREMALAEVRQREVAKRLFPFRTQVLRRIFTVLRRIALRRNKASSGRCCFRRGKPLPNVLKKLTSNIFTSRPTRRSTMSSSIFGIPDKQST